MLLLLYEKESESLPLETLIKIFDAYVSKKERIDVSLLRKDIIRLLEKEKEKKRLQLISSEEVAKVLGKGKGVQVERLPALVHADMREREILAVFYMEDVLIEDIEVLAEL